MKVLRNKGYFFTVSWKQKAKYGDGIKWYHERPAYINETMDNGRNKNRGERIRD